MRIKNLLLLIGITSGVLFLMSRNPSTMLLSSPKTKMRRNRSLGFAVDKKNHVHPKKTTTEGMNHLQ